MRFTKMHPGFVPALLVAALGYGLLCFRQPAGWGVPLWAVLAFLVLPAAVGAVVGRFDHPDISPRGRFITGAIAGGGAVFVYAVIEMIVAHHAVASSGNAAFVIGFVACVYGAVAGLVAGAVSSRFTGDQAVHRYGRTM